MASQVNLPGSFLVCFHICTNMEKFNRFDFEQMLLECWGVTSDIKLLNEMHQDYPGDMTADQVANYLLGLETIYEVKFNKLFNMFEAMCRDLATSEQL